MENLDTRAINRQIALGYDEVPFDLNIGSGMDPNRVFGLGAIYGCDAKPRDVLDLGCGHGAQLVRAGLQTTGKLVGVDLSEESCRSARVRCEQFGDRARILCSDLLDLTPQDVGEFDIIYCIGVIYVAPPEVRRHVLELISKCLRPGGVAVISYYVGAIPSARLQLYRIVRAIRTPGLDRQSAIAEARETLKTIAQKIAVPSKPVFLRAMKGIEGMSDSTFFHEAFNPNLESLQTIEVGTLLANLGLSFLNYYSPNEFGGLATSKERIFAAEIFDVTWGGYQYAHFGRLPSDELGPNLGASSVVWKSALVRQSGIEGYHKPAEFLHQGSGATINVPNPLSQALLDELGQSAVSLTEGIARAHRRLAAEGLTATDLHKRHAVESDLWFCWNHRLVLPSLSPQT